MADKRVDEPTGTDFVGHEWDGIEELDTPLPRWWLIIFYACIIWAAAYTVAYPAWPLINSATQGVLGYSSRAELAEDMAAVEAERAPLRAAIAEISIEDLPADEQLMQTAVQGGRSAFIVHCVQCHGSGAAGSAGYPNLNDDDWLWGGDMAAIEYTLIHGIRNPNHDETRISQMPAFGADGILNDRQIADVVSYVRTFNGAEEASAASARGAELYTANCAVCHGENGGGDQTQGAPNLRDTIWLYGGDRAAITNTVTNSRFGVMPRWGHRLDPVTIRMLAAYVWSLGGGETAPTVPDDEGEDVAEAQSNEPG
ncbi:cytochrome-c oxidase, cbb3-type subunit III [Parasphingopyxis lamellibrachiae]|uniref:Cbb3-type cytochrome c oxidase subunit n=1 Tax=Parasphingopyxis lamellibrachiae TaxID=680125 RepID=A0A3D9FF70_9SPHN|nr:cytochrome-c oxidase, cbb3-type subunit III [Parasphingopyxis lamellibrachiae]RED16298.1 cytochrome c oxidase cbb3-type subunit 3 [Parasphingopyxis lamellibrachiae]